MNFKRFAGYERHILMIYGHFVFANTIVAVPKP